MNEKTFWGKIGALLTSVRFWIITLSALSAYFAASKAAGGFDIVVLLDTIKVWLGVVAGVGTLDKIAGKFSNKPTA